MGIATVDNNRICRLKGTPREIGSNHGRALKDIFEEYVYLYVEDGLQTLNLIDLEKLRCAALPWLRKLPLRFQEEIEGLNMSMSKQPESREHFQAIKTKKGGQSG